MADTTRADDGQQTHAANDGHHLVGHGNSVAAWTAVGIVLLGAAMSCGGVLFTSLWLFIAGFVVIALGAVVGKVMAAMGYGSTAHQDPPTSPRQGVR